MEQKIISEQICHYTKIESGLNILSEKKIRLNKIGKTNDPRESRPWELLTFLKPRGNPKFDKLINDANKIIRNVVPKVIMEEWKVLCLTLDGLGQTEQTNEVFKKMFAVFLDPGYSRPRMWAQYGENHKGFCLVFDKDKLINKLKNKFGARCLQGKALYDGITSTSLSIMPPPATSMLNDIKILSPKEVVRKYVADHFSSFFLRKNPDWANETEYRWLVHSSNSEFENILIEGVITEVLAGMDFPKIHEPSLIAFCEVLEIQARRMKWHNGVPEPKETFEVIFSP